MDKAWKRAERDVAKVFGTCRNPLSGENSGVTGSDSRHPRLFIETKMFSGRGPYAAIYKLYDEVAPRAQSEGKTPILSIKRKGSRGFLVVVHYKDLNDVAIEIAKEDLDGKDEDSKTK
jgi:hypothetical protein